MSSAGSALWREVATVAGVVRRRWQAAGVAGFAWALALSAAVVVVSLLDHHRGTQQWISACCGERDGYPFGLWLARLPGSMLAPAQGLPIWGSLVQILLAFGIAEAAVGRRLAAGVALLGHVVATAAARLVLTAGALAGGLAGGLAANRFALDTGPSAATVALAAYLAVVLRLPILGAITGVGLAGAAFTHSGLAAGEHAVAALVGLACGLGQLAWLRWEASRYIVSSSKISTAHSPSLP